MEQRIMLGTSRWERLHKEGIRHANDAHSVVLRTPPPRRTKRRTQTLVLDDDIGYSGNLRWYVSSYLLTSPFIVYTRLHIETYVGPVRRVPVDPEVAVGMYQLG
jgi:hypothetical protein